MFVAACRDAQYQIYGPRDAWQKRVRSTKGFSRPLPCRLAAPYKLVTCVMNSSSAAALSGHTPGRRRLREKQPLHDSTVQFRPAPPSLST